MLSRTDQEAATVVPQVVLEHPGHRGDHHGHLLHLFQHLPHGRRQQHPRRPAGQPQPVHGLRVAQLLGDVLQLGHGHHGLLRLGQGSVTQRIRSLKLDRTQASSFDDVKGRSD